MCRIVYIICLRKMFNYQAKERICCKFFGCTLGQILIGDLCPGTLSVPASRPHFSKDTGRQFACIFLIAISAKDNYQLFSILAGYYDHAYVMNMCKKIGYHDKNIRISNAAQVDINAFFAGFHGFQGDLKIF